MKKPTVINTNLDMQSTMQMIKVDNVVYSILIEADGLFKSNITDKQTAQDLKQKAHDLLKLLQDYADFTIIFEINDVQYTREKITKAGQIEWLNEIINRLNKYEKDR